jgi:hypothetical protein
VADLIPFSTALAVCTNVSEERKSTSPSAIQLKNWRMTISTEEILDIISRFKKDKLLTYGIMLDLLTVARIRDNSDRITESAKSGTKVFV